VVIKRFKADAWDDERGVIQILREVRLLRFLRDSWIEASSSRSEMEADGIAQTDAVDDVMDDGVAASAEQQTPTPPPHHPNIIQMLDCFFAPCLVDPACYDLYIVMENGGAPLLSRTVYELNAEEQRRKVRCAFFGRNLHSRMPLDPTHVRLKRTYV
jgi:hypothetical protein